MTEQEINQIAAHLTLAAVTVGAAKYRAGEPVDSAIATYFDIREKLLARAALSASAGAP